MLRSKASRQVCDGLLTEAAMRYILNTQQARSDNDGTCRNGCFLNGSSRLTMHTSRCVKASDPAHISSEGQEFNSWTRVGSSLTCGAEDWCWAEMAPLPRMVALRVTMSTRLGTWMHSLPAQTT